MKTKKIFQKKVSLSHDYDKENNILSVRWTKDKTKYCDELDDGKHYYVIDFNNKNEIIGIEIFDWYRKDRKKNR